MSRDFKSRRVFITAGAEVYKILDFTQNKTDGSIYASSPDFSEIQWLHVTKDKHIGRLSVVDSPGEGKLSLHGSGMAATRAHNDPRGHTLVVHGNYLLNLPKQKIGVRHLFTTFMTEPSHVPASPAFNRESDVVFKVDQLKPYVLIFWAIPAIRHLTINVTASFHVDDLESIPPESGFGGFSLVHHSIVWFGYRTKHMHKWPKQTRVCYYDGHGVPILVGTNEGECRLEIRSPIYELSQDKLALKLDFSANGSQPDAG